MNLRGLVILGLLVFSLSTQASYINLDIRDELVIYTPQYRDGTSTVLADEYVVQRGNNWVALYGPFNITSDSVLNISFRSTHIGEIHGIGFDVDTEFSWNNYIRANKYFQFAGSQEYGIQDFNTYTDVGSTQQFTIDVGTYFTGLFNYIVFINDDDATPNSAVNSVYFQEEDYSISSSSNANSVSAPTLFSLLFIAIAGLFRLRSRTQQ